MSGKSYYLQTRSGLYWAGNGWWSRRKDQAKRFDSEVDALRERDAQIVVNVDVKEPQDALEEQSPA